jgi:hypothetical protein
MSRLPAVLLVAPLLAAALAGCVQTPSGTQEVAPAAVLGLAPATEPLWNNPQTAPHPLFNYPTLSNPATGADVPSWWRPIAARPLPDHIAGLELVTSTTDQAKMGAGMSVFGSLAVVPGYGEPTAIFDISDPGNPVLLSTLDDVSHRNVDFIAYPSGRLVIVLSTGEGKLPVWDITDPTKPEHLVDLEPESGTHKVNVVPGTPIVYNANSNGGGGLTDPSGMTPATAKGQTEIFDLTDPESPVLVQNWKNGFGCHHIYFWNSAEKQRALCAGIEFTQIWDTADPRNPTVIVNVPVHHGVAGTPSASAPVVGILAFSHFSILNDDGTILIVGDEMEGGSFPPGCTAPGAPTGAIWFYDVKDETDPKLLGWFSPGHHMDPGRASVSCTAHHGRLVPDPEGRDMLAMAFYGGGVVLVDFSDPRLPQLVDQFNDDTDTWEVQYYNGYLFTGDLRRGMDVLSFR